MNPTDEQLAIVRNVHKYNIVVDAVAGSGKTSTIKFIAMTYVKESILVMMYNKERRKETIASMRKYGFGNIDIHTFNSAGYGLYGEDCFDNRALDNIILRDRKPIPFYYNIFILDEIQDKTDLYYRFVQKLMRDSKTGKPIRIVMLGDYLQAINQFNGSKIDFILNPEKFYPGEWLHLPLNRTFRLTKPMVDLVNGLAFGGGGEDLSSVRKLVSVKDSAKRPKYLVCDDTAVIAKIREYLQIYNPQDIFILTPTTRKSRNIANLCNLLTAEGVPLYVTGEKYTQSESMNGKLVVSTIHVAKGSERKVVFVYGFDSSILPKMLDNSTDTSSTDSLLYVALTRASEELIIFHGKGYKFIVPKEVILKFCDFQSCVPIDTIEYGREFKQSSRPRTVTDLVKYISYEKIKACMDFIEIIKLEQPGINLAEAVPKLVPSSVQGSMEDVSDINGLIVPSYHAGFSFDYVQLKKYFSEIYSKNKSSYTDLIARSIEMVIHAQGKKDIHTILKAATAYWGLCNELFYKTEQIKSFDWMTIEFLDSCSELMTRRLGDFIEYEVPAKCDFVSADGLKRAEICGRIDAIDMMEDLVYEFKCVDTLLDEHVLQLALYSFIRPASGYRLLNIYTGELLEIKFKEGKSAKDILEILI